MVRKRRSLLVLVSVLFTLSAQPTAANDGDGDGVPDTLDNCSGDPNNQLDVDLDGYGNACDADFNNNGVVESKDYILLQANYGCTVDDSCWDEDAVLADIDGNGAVGGTDLISFMSMYTNPPGPSGLACQGQSGCVPPPPIDTLPVVAVRDANYDDGYDQADIDAAMLACGDGCNLLFLAESYDDVAMEVGPFPDGFAMYGYGQGVTTLRSPLFGPDDWGPVIYLTPDAPSGDQDLGIPGVQLLDMTLDGRTDEQVPPGNPGAFVDLYQTNRHCGISSLISVASDRSNGRAANLEIRDFAYAGVELDAATNWVIEDNWIHGMGCNQVDDPCGELLQEPNPWDGMHDDSNSPNRKTPGHGILIKAATQGTIVRGNVVEGTTKGAIHTYTRGGENPALCGDPGSTDHILIEGNLATASQTGFVSNGGCYITFQNNTADGMRVTGGVEQQLGRGFACKKDGEGNQWIDNTSQNNQASGFWIRCGHGNDIVFSGNRAIDNCQGDPVTDTGSNVSDIEIVGPVGSPSTGLTIEGLNTSGSSACESGGLQIANYTNVMLDGGEDGAIEGGAYLGLLLSGVTNAEVENLTITADPESSSSFGVFFDFKKGGLSQVFVQPTTQVTGFANEYKFNDGHYLGDGDDVAYCLLEDPQPEGCDPVP